MMKRTRLDAPLGQPTTQTDSHPDCAARRQKAPRFDREAFALATIIASVALSLILGAAPAIAGVTTDEVTRRIATGPKLIQIDVMGIRRDAPPAVETQVGDEPGLRVSEKHREFRARPTEPVSVGLIGCPGCMEVLRAVRPVVMERRGRGDLR